MQVSLDVRGKQTLEESLDFYVQGELMEGDNQYLCEELGKKVDSQHAHHIAMQCGMEQASTAFSVLADFVRISSERCP